MSATPELASPEGKSTDWGHDTRSYTVPCGPMAGAVFPSITTIIGAGVPKNHLVDWAAKQAATRAVENFDELRTRIARDGTAEAIRWVSKAHTDIRDDAGKAGTAVHKYAELVAAGAEPGGITKALVENAGMSGPVRRFADDWAPTWLYTEATVFSETHRYAGTFDFVAWIAGFGVVIGDYKATRSGIRGTVALQLAAGRYADWIAVKNVDGSWRQEPLPGIVGGVAVLIRPDDPERSGKGVPPGVTVYPVECGDEAFDLFLSARQIGEWQSTGERDLIGAPVPPPKRLGGGAETREAWLVARVGQLVDLGHAAAVATRWPTPIPTFGEARQKLHGYTAGELAEIASMLDSIEAAVQAPFIAPPMRQFAKLTAEAIEAAPKAHPDKVDATFKLWRDLPSDLATSVHVHVSRLGVTHPTKPQTLTAAELDIIDEAVRAGSQIASARRDQIGEALKGIPDADAEELMLLASFDRVDHPDDLTELETERLLALADAFTGEYIAIVDEEMSPDSDVWAAVLDRRVSALVRCWGGKSRANAAAKWVADRHGLTAPRSTAKVAADPLLFALTLSATPPPAVTT